jgi:crotonobetainyl-CoA:carnitine CoA-transferase CaiB-like acyl-CoA transferase
MRGNLDGVRVLDLTTEPGHFATKLLGDLGADVVKIEPPGGDPVRRRGPFWGHADDPERSLVWLAYNTSKRGITLDVAKPRGRDILLDLVRRSDVVVESFAPGTLAELGLSWDELHAKNPRQILCSLTPWGQTGPHAGWRGSDLTVVAMSGNLHCTGDPDRAPVRCSLPVAHYHASIEAALGITFALIAREQTGRGQHLDVAMHAAMIMPNIATASMFKIGGNRGNRAGAFFRQGQSVQREIWPCKDGFVSFALRGGPARIPGLIAMVKLMDENGMASPAMKAMDWKTYNHNLLTQDEVDALTKEFGAFFASKTMTELFTAAVERNLMLAPANTAREIDASEQLAFREFFVEVDHPGRGRLRFPGGFAKIRSSTSDDPAAMTIGIRRPAPRIGEHTAEVLAEVGVTEAMLAELHHARVC